jgi:starch phosphorylase
MKAAISSLSFFFNTNRMVAEYTKNFYMPVLDRTNKLAQNDYAGAQDLSSWRQRLRSGWDAVRVVNVEGDLPNEIQVGQAFEAKAEINLGQLSPDDVCVELYVGLVNPRGELVQGEAVTMDVVENLGNGKFIYQAQTKCQMSGLHGYTVRVLPYNPSAVTSFLPGFIRWAG